MRQLFYLLSFLLVIFSCSKDNEIIEEEKYLSVDLSEIEITKQAQGNGSRCASLVIKTKDQENG